jgi:hypothetical protein
MKGGRVLPRQSGLPGRAALAVPPSARLSSSFIVRFKELSHAIPTSRLRRFFLARPGPGVLATPGSTTATWTACGALGSCVTIA